MRADYTLEHQLRELTTRGAYRSIAPLLLLSRGDPRIMQFGFKYGF